MRLHYYKDPQGNFGDDLNAWLWPQLVPHLLQGGDELFVGIGTLLNHRLPPNPVKHIFGSGVGYGRLPICDDRLVFHAVRGHLSAQALGLPKNKVITDSAVLIRLLPRQTRMKRFRCGMILTGHSLRQYDWQSVCDHVGIRFISCHWPVERVLTAMEECEVILCEAMHGAIVADALRIPWIPVSLYGELLEFKWKDWLSSLGMNYHPVRLEPLYAPQKQSRLSKLKSETKHLLKQLGITSEQWTAPPNRPTGAIELDRVMNSLYRLSQTAGQLSREAELERFVQRFAELLELHENSSFWNKSERTAINC